MSLCDEVKVTSANDRITLALIGKEEAPLAEAQEYILTAMGTTGMDETEYKPRPEMMGIPLRQWHLKENCTRRLWRERSV